MQRYAAVFILVVLMCGYRLVTYVIESREAINRTACKGHLKHIVLALHNYETVYGELPPAYTVDENGKPLHSWRTLILPYVDQNELYNSIDLSKPWNDPANQKAYHTEISTYYCPSIQARLAPGLTTYQAIVGPDAALQPVKSHKFSDILDGTTNTAIVIDVNLENAVHWMSPVDHGEEFMMTFEPKSQLQHDRGTNTLFADGMIRFLSTKMSANTRKALIDIDNGTMCDEF